MALLTMRHCDNCKDLVDVTIPGDDGQQYCFGCATVAELTKASEQNPDNVTLKMAAATASASVMGVIDSKEK